MPRARKNPADAWLPQGVYRGKSAYEWRPKGGGAIKLRALERDTQGSVIETTATRTAVLVAHAAMVAEHTERKDMRWLITQYMESPQWKGLSEGERYNDTLRLQRIIPVFGKMYPGDVKPVHGRLYMDKLGMQSITSANRDHGFLSRVFSWGYERGHTAGNPLRDVKKFSEKPRDRYIEDWEFDLVYEVALQSSYPWIAPMMEIAYLCRMRAGEVRSIMEDKHILAHGLFVERGKGSKNEITAWSPRLEKAIADAKLLRPKGPMRLSNRPLFANKTGGPVSKTGFDSAWQRVREQAIQQGIIIEGRVVRLTESFNFHDLKAKGITDHETKAGGHRSKKMEAVYDRKPAIIKATR